MMLDKSAGFSGHESPGCADYLSRERRSSDEHSKLWAVWRWGCFYDNCRQGQASQCGAESSLLSYGVSGRLVGICGFGRPCKRFCRLRTRMPTSCGWLLGMCTVQLVAGSTPTGRSTIKPCATSGDRWSSWCLSTSTAPKYKGLVHVGVLKPVIPSCG